jgi:hypothetical protein
LVEDKNCVAEKRKSEGITFRENKKNKIHEDNKSVAAHTRIYDLSPKKNTDFETQSCEIPCKTCPGFLLSGLNLKESTPGLLLDKTVNLDVILTIF